MFCIYLFTILGFLCTTKKSYFLSTNQTYQKTVKKIQILHTNGALRRNYHNHHTPPAPPPPPQIQRVRCNKAASGDTAPALRCQHTAISARHTRVMSRKQHSENKTHIVLPIINIDFDYNMCV